MRNNLDILLADGVINEVLGHLQSGKEADVYCVRYRGQPVAAKIYKDRQQRSFKHNAAYKEGRKVRNSRTQRAMDKGSRFGRDEAEDAWKASEATTLHLLHGHGVRVPTPVMFYEGVLLMQFVTDADGHPAPRLVDAPIPRAHAGALYRDLRGQIVGVLCCDLIHGDLSPYNVLLGAAGPTLIDFPQAISAAHNQQSEMFFRRDLDNILHFCAGLDPSLRAHRGDARAIWAAYLRRELTPDWVPAPAARFEDERRPPPLPPGEGARPPRREPWPQRDQARSEQHARPPQAAQPDLARPQRSQHPQHLQHPRQHAPQPPPPQHTREPQQHAPQQHAPQQHARQPHEQAPQQHARQPQQHARQPHEQAPQQRSPQHPQPQHHSPQQHAPQHPQHSRHPQHPPRPGPSPVAFNGPRPSHAGRPTRATVEVYVKRNAPRDIPPEAARNRRLDPTEEGGAAAPAEAPP